MKKLFDSDCQVLSWLTLWPNHESIEYILMSKDNVIIGSCSIERGKNDGGEYFRLLSFYIQPSYRNLSYGYHLLENVVDDFKYADIHLLVDLENEKAIKLYDRFNFIDCDDCINPNGQKWMVRKLTQKV